jgi:hypothetical protein
LNLKLYNFNKNEIIVKPNSEDFMFIDLGNNCLLSLTDYFSHNEPDTLFAVNLGKYNCDEGLLNLINEIASDTLTDYGFFFKKNFKKFNLI